MTKPLFRSLYGSYTLLQWTLMQIITSNYSTLPSIGEIKQDFVLFRLVFYHSNFVLHDYNATKYFCSISINEKKPNPEKNSFKKKNPKKHATTGGTESTEERGERMNSL